MAGRQSSAIASMSSAMPTVISSQTLKAAKTAESTTVEQVSTSPSSALTSSASPTKTPTKAPTPPKQSPSAAPTQQAPVLSPSSSSVPSPSQVEVATPVNSQDPVDVTIFDTAVPVVTLHPNQDPPPPPIPIAVSSSPPKSSSKANPIASVAPVSISPVATPTQASTPSESEAPILSAPDPRSSFLTITTPSTESIPLLFPTDDFVSSAPKVSGLVSPSVSGSASASTPSRTSTAGIISPAQSNDGAEPKGKSKGSVVGGVLGAIIVLVLLGVVAFFMRKKLKRKQALNEARRSFGPFGNGIDASTGSALVSSLPPKTEPPMSEFARNDYSRYGTPSNANITNSSTPIPTSASNNVALAVPIPGTKRKPISTIEEKSERGSMQSVAAFEKKGPLRVLNANPFEDSAIAEKKEPTLPHISMMEPMTVPDVSPISSPAIGSTSSPISPHRANVSPVIGGVATSAGGGTSTGGSASSNGIASSSSGHGMAGAVAGTAVGAAAVGAGIAAARPNTRSPPRSERSPGFHNNNNSGMGGPMGQRPYNSSPGGMPLNTSALPPRGMPAQGQIRGAYDQNRPRAPPGSQGPYRYPSARERYPPGRIGDGPPPGPYSMRRRRSSSLDQGYPRNPLLDQPSWQRWAGPPPTSRGRQHNSPYFGDAASMSETGLHRRPSAASVRERPSPEYWGPLDTNSHGMGLQQPPLMMRPGAAQSQPDLHTYQSSAIDEGRYHGQYGVGSGSNHGTGPPQRSSSRGAAARNF